MYLIYFDHVSAPPRFSPHSYPPSTWAFCLSFKAKQNIHKQTSNKQIERDEEAGLGIACQRKLQGPSPCLTCLLDCGEMGEVCRVPENLS